jgi:hypothetical protein
LTACLSACLSVVRVAIGGWSEVTVTWCKQTWQGGQWHPDRKWRHM